MNRFEFKEGETIVLTGYLPDITDKSKIICIEYMTKHSMEVNNWQGKFFFSLLNYKYNYSKLFSI
jgi:hypothetical protein